MQGKIIEKYYDRFLNFQKGLRMLKQRETFWEKYFRDRKHKNNWLIE